MQENSGPSRRKNLVLKEREDAGLGVRILLPRVILWPIRPCLVASPKSNLICLNILESVLH